MKYSTKRGWINTGGHCIWALEGLFIVLRIRIPIEYFLLGPDPYTAYVLALIHLLILDLQSCSLIKILIKFGLLTKKINPQHWLYSLYHH